MQRCPHCGNEPLGQVTAGCSGTYWGWALCRRCGFPLEKWKIYNRLIASRDHITEALWLEPISEDIRQMSGDQALVYLEQLIESPIVPIYEGLDLVIFNIVDDTLAFNLGKPIRNADELAEVLKG